MKIKIFLLSALFVLASCGKQDVESPIGAIPEPAPKADYSRALDAISDKVQATPEFQSCLESSIMSCKNTSVIQIADRTGDIAYCDELGDDTTVQNCRFSLSVTAAMKSLDITNCSVLADPYLKNCQKQVYKLKAIKELDSEVCDMMITATGSAVKKEERTEVQECLLGVILANTGAVQKDCDKIADLELKKSCQTTLQQR